MIRGSNPRPEVRDLNASAWEYVIRRGYLSPREIKEAMEFAKAAVKLK